MSNEKDSNYCTELCDDCIGECMKNKIYQDKKMQFINQTAEQVSLKYFLTLKGNTENEFRELKQDQPNNFKAIIDSMEEFASIKTAHLEADKAELLRGLKDITRQFERVGRLYSLDQKAISAANALIQKHAAK